MRPGYTSWSISTFHVWVTQFCPHIHRKSGTVYGGPLGVRTIAFAISRICQKVSRVTSAANVPLAIQQVALGPRRTWSSTETDHLVNDCISHLRKDVAKSRSILQVTYRTRADQWEEMIRMLTEQHLQQGTRQRGDVLDTGPSATSGVPHSFNLLLEIHEVLSKRSHYAEDTDHTLEASFIQQQHREETLVSIQTGRHEASVEFIDIDAAIQDEPSEGAVQSVDLNPHAHAYQDTQ